MTRTTGPTNLAGPAPCPASRMAASPQTGRSAAPRGNVPLRGTGGGQAEIMFQPWLTLFGAGSAVTEGAMQPASGWLDARANKYTLLVGIPEVTNCELFIETAIDAAGPWREVGSSYTSDTFESEVLASDSLDELKSFDRYLRWRVKPTAVSWSICFQLKALPSETQPSGRMVRA